MNMHSTLPPLHRLGLLPPSFVCTADYLLSHTLSHVGQQGPPYPSAPFVHRDLGCSLWPPYGHLETMQAIRPKSRSRGSLQQFVNFPGCGENPIQKLSVFQLAR